MSNKILVVGSDGYIGSQLCKKLQENFDVTGYDTGYYRGAYLYSPQWNLPKTITKDIRLITIDEIIGFKAVVCLSDLNDPLSQNYPEVTKKINYEGLARFATLCKEAGVERFLYSSSVSVYGFASDKQMDEKSELSPLTPYAECKVLMEKHLMSLNDEHFGVACLRNSTVYGLSPRMRFDLVINYLC
jgi:nucleoside-diphosphate-sugar epimerase